MADNNIEKTALRQQAYATFQRGQLPLARDLYGKLAALDEKDGEAWHMLSAIHGMLGEYARAESCCRKVTAIRPSAGAFCNLGNACRFQGKWTDAEQSYKEALRLNPNYAEGHNNLGNLYLQQEKLDFALRAYQDALRCNPQYAEAHNNLGATLIQLNRLEEAFQACRKAVQINPQYADALNNLGNILQKANKIKDAVSAYRQALALNPNLPETHGSLGTMLRGMGLITDAVVHFRQALHLKPDFIQAQMNIAFSLNYDPDAEPHQIFSEHVRYGEMCAPSAAPAFTPRNIPDEPRRLRVGYVSPDFREHAVAYFLRPLLETHDRNNVEIFCYANVKKPDAVTERLRTLSQHWRDTFALSNDQFCDAVQQDRIDILVDLAGHTAHNRLECFARRLAPVQVTYLGYPNTSGLADMDYRLTDAIADPPGAEAFYTEKLVRLEKTFFIYAPPESAPPVTPLPSRRNGYITYGSLNTPAKYNHRVISLWSRLLAGLPQSRLLLVHEGLHADLKDYLHEQFARQGIHPSRITLENNLSQYDGHLSIYGQMDVALDPFPWSGHTTTCEALWMGVSTVTLYGKTCAGRMCASTLISAGLPELVTGTDAEYIAAAHKLAGDTDALEHLRSSMRERLSKASFSDAAAFARRIEDAYRTMWKNWCHDAAKTRITL